MRGLRHQQLDRCLNESAVSKTTTASVDSVTCCLLGPLRGPSQYALDGPTTGSEDCEIIGVRQVLDPARPPLSSLHHSAAAPPPWLQTTRYPCLAQPFGVSIPNLRIWRTHYNDATFQGSCVTKQYADMALHFRLPHETRHVVVYLPLGLVALAFCFNLPRANVGLTDVHMQYPVHTLTRDGR